MNEKKLKEVGKAHNMEVSAHKALNLTLICDAACDAKKINVYRWCMNMH